jgi:predicted alpha/beta superfamily hydrolase
MRVFAAVLALAAACLPIPGPPAEAAPLSVVSDAAALPPGFEHYVLHSDRLGRDFEIWVNPPSATAFLPGQKFPVIYALDAGYGIAGPQGLLLGSTGAMAPAITVSVGYKPGQAVLRNTDLTHAKFQAQGLPAGATPIMVGGGGAAFEAFLQEDLKPFIEAKYPADPKRSILFGHSLGGLFAANVFADNPDAYAGYIIGSASAWADPNLVARVAAAASKAHGARIYLAVGEDEDAVAITGDARMRKGYLGLAAALKGRTGVVLRTQIYPGESHLSYYPRLITDGFPFVLPPARPTGAAQTRLAPAALARAEGVYKMPDGRQLRIFSQPNGLMSAQVTGIPVVPLMQNGPDRFYNPTSDIDAVFDGKSLTMTAGGGAKLTIPRDTAPWAGGGPTTP